ncbi:ferredoxin--NADP(+) reductase OS=Tsukamurella paurometabola (strain ATCC 8368 / DSM / CCUG 35730/ CIP 100753 / JCM 10117 / KCTC 9821 / NBRC 16120 / NCIMB 702349 / NCTC 13040) OX=521096 GN=Tpau_2945 PE=4 SV=1 [Tsukamurella paurometabola]|uniref:ferredoxin--NADP(+) reductase n=1 Tax=Tsukamurella paurometabola (strain ATCC 8368 / DSM 20162 / CCUG 35730 / CIP 100753 / JCM 10117 / KCTC 9821 / NBRC 16120 / NCIMB 702349 / NCTC 13040) TaxID=521096 RepID=D5UU40_TSUPD|nr:FAD-dependent oxidoreductase [Tsukamurella paurometabola]ADG79543.1 4Fe-4S ferredoxin iron-sulfur binding domain protein [Tsukamurella paurometabola DSM 20162]SUP36161.1 NADPH-ferredoxin reductase fprA [Tsukamurella paurometabola]
MPHVITQSCCSDAACTFACPVNCIHPTPDEPGFATAEMLYVDPTTCVDCGACVTACPVDAIGPAHRLPEEHKVYIEINRSLAAADPANSSLGGPNPQARSRPPMAHTVPPKQLPIPDGTVVSVGVIGSGPAAMYAADELLRWEGVTVDVYEKLSTPYGLARFGVAPDHTRTRKVSGLFDKVAADPNFHIHLNTEVGRDISLEELRRRHDAIIVAVGASTDKKLGIPGEELPNVRSATDFVAWYNGHPEHRGDDVDLSHDRIVIIGNGNVALDAARILTAEPEELEGTTISPAALAALKNSKVEEVVIVARRGPEHAAFTLPEALGLADERTVIVHPDPDVAESLVAGSDSELVSHKLQLLESLETQSDASRRIRLRFLTTPESIEDTGDGLVLHAKHSETGEAIELPVGMVFTSVGYRGVPVEGLPFDERRAVLPNEAGRVLGDDGAPIPGVYVTGWIKRGPNGFIGTNKTDSQETVERFAEDVVSGVVTGRPLSSRGKRKRALGRFLGA